MADDYKIGYRRPPHHTRFRKGHSGNPRGRPKGSPNVPAEMQRLLRTKTRIKVGGSYQDVPTSMALCMALVNKGLQGDVRAFSKIAEVVGPQLALALTASAPIAPEDGDIVRAALARQDQRAAERSETSDKDAKEDPT